MAAPRSGFRAYVIVWAGQFLSLLGSGLTGFALGVYVYQQTGSATTLAAIFALSLSPSIVAAPFAGSLVDRWGTKRSLVFSNSANTLLSLVLAGLLFTETFAVWHVYPVVVAGSLVAALEIPAFIALAPQLVPRKHLGRVNGMRMSAIATTGVLAPAIAGVLLVAAGLKGVVLVDLASFGPVILALCVVRIPRIRPPDPAAGTARRSLWAESKDGWRYIAARPGLLALLLFLGAVNFSEAFLDLLIMPLVLSFAPPSSLGVVLSVGAIGMVATGVALSVWGGPRRKVRGVLWFSLLLAPATVLGAVRPNVALIAVAAFVFMGAFGIVVATNQAIWQTKVEHHLMGRVVAIVNMVSQVPQLLAYAIAGVAVDRVFEPLVGHDEVRSGTMAILIGDGPGRGIALMILIVGGLIAVSVAIAASSRRLRALEDELPDVALPQDEAAPEPVAGRA
jgi:DHA3 family macrolide efflux protein-like MFS transporter